MCCIPQLSILKYCSQHVHGAKDNQVYLIFIFKARWQSKLWDQKTWLKCFQFTSNEFFKYLYPTIEISFYLILLCCSEIKSECLHLYRTTMIRAINAATKTTANIPIAIATTRSIVIYWPAEKKSNKLDYYWNKGLKGEASSALWLLLIWIHYYTKKKTEMNDIVRNNCYDIIQLSG